MNQQTMNKQIGSFIKSNLWQIAGLTGFLLTLWLSTKLSPLQENLSLVNQRVFALEDRVQEQSTKDDITAVRDEINFLRDDIKELRTLIINRNQSNSD